MDSSIFIVFALLILVLALAGLVWWILAIVDMVKRTDGEWASAQQDKTIWLIGVIVGGFFVSPLIAAAIYWFVAKPKLDSASGLR